jgi:hypothetical protein
MRFQQRGNAIRRLCALPNPILYSVNIDTQILFMVFADRIEVTHTFDVPAIPTITTIGDNQVIKGTFLCASARKTNTNHCNSVKTDERQTYLSPG